MQKENLLSSILAFSKCYDFVQHATGSYRFKRGYMKSIESQLIGKKVIEVGCGTGYLAQHTPQCDYLGFDISEGYVNVATKTSPNHCKFSTGDCIELLMKIENKSIDVVIAGGIFHHLTPQQFESLLVEISRVLTTNGTLLSFEPVWPEDNNWIRKRIMKFDRGTNIQSESIWRQYFSTHFQNVSIVVKNGAFNIPYTIGLIECR